VDNDHAKRREGHEGVVPRAVHAIVAEVARLHEVADEGQSDATPAILVGAVLAFVVPLVSFLILLVFGVADLS
jgi:hypothetical protein